MQKIGNFIMTWHGVAGNQHTNVVYDVLRFLGLSSRPRKVCSPTAIKRMRTESGPFSIKCVAGSMKESKELDPSFSFGHSYDGTRRLGIPYQVDATHFKAPNGELASGIIGVHLPPNKKAITQVKATAISFHNLKQLSQGVVEPSNCKTRITNGANNEKATNNLEGQPWTNCLQHSGSNATKHGVAPTITTGWIDCPCGQEKPPTLPTTDNPTKWCGCVVCKTWVHEECVAPVVNPFICTTCSNLGACALEGDIKWHDATDKLRKLSKRSLSIMVKVSVVTFVLGPPMSVCTLKKCHVRLGNAFGNFSL